MYAKESVAIIGSGMSGLVSAKYALENDLVPFVFERSAAIGGEFWSLDSSKKSTSLPTNVSIFRETFSDFLWPKNSKIFPTALEVISYLDQYVDKFFLNKHIFLNQEVLLARQLSNDKWEIISQNYKTNEKKVETFDFLIITSGKYSDPDTPHIQNSKDFNGIQMYDSEFDKNDLRLESKKVAVVN